MTDRVIEKYFASIYLAMIGDKIGFGNGEIETNFHFNKLPNDSKLYEAIEGLTKRMVYQFISKGGITGFNTTEFEVSDDTLMNVNTFQGLVSNYKNNDELYNNITNEYIESFKDIDYARDVLLAGRQTIESINRINSGASWRNFPYSKNAGGSGGPMRVMGLGLAFHKNSNILQLIESTIMITSITHPNCIAFLGSIASALFTSYALKGMNIETWIFELMTLLETDKIDGIIEKIKPNYIEHFIEDKKSFIFKLNTYIEDSFRDYNFNVSEVQDIFLENRVRYYKKFSEDKRFFSPGSGADDCIIVAYDCLLLSKNSYEKLVYKSMLMIGDSDTVGSIASAWYGAYYGFDNVPLNLINKSDLYYDVLKTISLDMYNKYYKI